MVATKPHRYAKLAAVCGSLRCFRSPCWAPTPHFRPAMPCHCCPIAAGRFQRSLSSEIVERKRASGIPYDHDSTSCNAAVSDSERLFRLLKILPLGLSLRPFGCPLRCQRWPPPPPSIACRIRVIARFGSRARHSSSHRVLCWPVCRRSSSHHITIFSSQVAVHEKRPQEDDPQDVGLSEAPKPDR